MKTTTSTTVTGDATNRLAGRPASQLASRLDLFRDAASRGWLEQGRRGIEKESLRVTPAGELALTAHPRAFGAALTHPEITTDYSESLLEFITPPVSDAVEAIEALRVLHRFVHRELGDELLWDVSMPGKLPEDSGIPIAEYGSSNQGRFKHIYRRGLALRYGRAMQCIAGIHYNFSLDERIWPLLHGTQVDQPAPDDIQSERYLGLIRNYRRFSWLLLYLFGASPALDRSFLEREGPDSSTRRHHGLAMLGEDTLYLPYATSLRMSDLGYHNHAGKRTQRPDLSSLRGYLASLAEAIEAPYEPYVLLGTHRDGDWIQLNTNLLQIENELYATIRPKRIGRPGERPLHALTQRGIQYVEVRCLDVDPFENVGIGETTVRFLDAFLLMCLLEDSPTDTQAQIEADSNFLEVAKDGRRPGRTLIRDGGTVELTRWAEQLLSKIDAAAAVLDSTRHDGAHAAALAAQRAKLADPATLPSARVLAGVEAAGSFAAFGLQQSRTHADTFRAAPVTAEQVAEDARLAALAEESIGRQAAIEAADTISFDDFVAQYGSEHGHLGHRGRLQDA